MKRNIKVILTGCALGLTGLASCTDGYEAEPVEKYTLDYVFSTTDSVGEQARKYLNGMYRILKSGHNRVGNDYLDAASDDAISIQYNESNVYKIATGQYTSMVRFDDMMWSEFYTTIREANILIPNIDRVPFSINFGMGYIKAGETETNPDGTLKQTPLNVTMKAEARFLRAWAYWNLVIRYGGVPLVGDRIFDIEDNLELPRNTFAECIEYIVSELDAIKDDLRGIPMGDAAAAYGAVPTREACLAFKTRILLYAASKLFNESPVEAGNELVGYASYDRNRWKLAADAAKEFMTTYEGSVFELNKNFRDVFLSFYSTNNREQIWFINGEINGSSLEKNNGPLGFTGNAQGLGRTLPTQNLVDAFPMLDGKKINESRYTYDPQNPYAYRDPRLNMTVLHQGSPWLGIELAMYQGGGNNPTSSALYSRTGYYMCKFMNDYSGTDKTEYQNSPHPWVVFRWAEILLNYAEAQNEYLDAPDQSVYDAIIALRKRAGIEPGDDNLYGLDPAMSQAEMREIIRNERRIEMAFEEQRFYDIRRWKIADKCFAEPLHGVIINNRDGVMSYSPNDVLNVTWDDRRYFYPISYSELVKNSNMIQNPNW